MGSTGNPFKKNQGKVGFPKCGFKDLFGWWDWSSFFFFWGGGDENIFSRVN